MAGGTSRSSISIDISIINDPAFGISPYGSPNSGADYCAATGRSGVMRGVPRFSTECCSALFQEAYGSSPSFSIIIHPILRF